MHSCILPKQVPNATEERGVHLISTYHYSHAYNQNRFHSFHILVINKAEGRDKKSIRIFSTVLQFAGINVVLSTALGYSGLIISWQFYLIQMAGKSQASHLNCSTHCKILSYPARLSQPDTMRPIVLYMRV